MEVYRAEYEYEELVFSKVYAKHAHLLIITKI